MAKDATQEALPAEPAVDGRRLRAQRSRERLLDALEEVLGQPGVDPSPERIAASAGVSVSTLFRHFGDFAGLNDAMRARVEARIRPHLVGVDYEGDLEARLAELVRRLTTAYETVAPFYRVSIRQRGRPIDPAQLPREIGTAMRSNLRAALEPELAAAPERETRIAAMLSFETWSHLNEVAGLPPERIVEELEAAVLALLA